ncbi:MAG: hypothetical protein GY884_28450 [Proteobacteria bacterium]|nr:hypothetical protein [Pseudomonadota bacterium]
MWPLGAFENLRRVGIVAASELEDVELLEDCEQLEELALYEVDGIETLGSVTDAPMLKTLRVERSSGSAALGRWAARTAWPDSRRSRSRVAGGARSSSTSARSGRCGGCGSSRWRGSR